jgi:aryl sulfotransferase
MITWISSYPKSGSTYLRLLINSYLCGGRLDINNLPYGGSDNRKYYYQAVAPVSVDKMTRDEIFFIRYAALFNMAYGMFQIPCLIKTHNVNGNAQDIDLIPYQITDRAFHVVRDPRNIIPSFSRHMDLTIDKSIEALNDREFSISNDGKFYHVLSDWSTHVNSWLNEHRYQVTLIKYEKLVDDPADTLRGVLDRLGIYIDEDYVHKAVEATKIDHLREQENTEGFLEKSSNNQFFHGQTDYQKDLTEDQIKRIEEQHYETMDRLGYTTSCGDHQGQGRDSTRNSA